MCQPFHSDQGKLSVRKVPNCSMQWSGAAFYCGAFTSKMVETPPLLVLYSINVPKLVGTRGTVLVYLHPFAPSDSRQVVK